MSDPKGTAPGDSSSSVPRTGQIALAAPGPPAAPAHGLVSWVRDLFSSPGLHLPADGPSRAALDVSTGLVPSAACSADVKARLQQYEERLLQLHRLASKQASDISELRSAAEGLQKRKATGLAESTPVTPAVHSSAAAASAPLDRTTVRYPSTPPFQPIPPDTTSPDRTTPEPAAEPGAGAVLDIPSGVQAAAGAEAPRIATAAAGSEAVRASVDAAACNGSSPTVSGVSPGVSAGPAAGSPYLSLGPAFSLPSSRQEPDVQRLFREAVGQAVGEQRTALAESHSEVLQLLRVLREQQAEAASQAASQWRESEWREALRGAGAAHAREKADLQARVDALVERDKSREREGGKGGRMEQEKKVAHGTAGERGVCRRSGDKDEEGRRAAVGGCAAAVGVDVSGDSIRGADGGLALADDVALQPLGAQRDLGHRERKLEDCRQRNLERNLGNLRCNLGELRADLVNLRGEARGILGEGAGLCADLCARLAAAVAGAEASLLAKLGREQQAERELFEARQEELLMEGEERAAAVERAHRAEVRALRSARREAVNRLQEAQGSIRVLCRCRPLSAAERAVGEVAALQPGAEHNTIGSMPAAASGRSAASDTREPTLSDAFRFDSVFGPGCTEAELFLEVSPAISSVVRGQFVCVMAYGQTGAGKTYTMFGGGGGNGGSAAGLIRLAAAQLLDESAAEAAERSDRGSPVTFSFGASLLEIYNDKVRDLLAGEEGPAEVAESHAHGGYSEPLPRDSASTQGRSHGSGWGIFPPAGMDVRVSSDGSVTVPGLTVVPFSDAAAVARLIASGVGRRVTHATRCNENSSRSHLVLTLHCLMRDDRNGNEVHGRCHLVDLAGSERISLSGVEGDRLRESNHINKSLSALEQVFVALQSRGKDASTHVPYRNSKLTMLLSDALGAKGACAKTLMLMQVSPAASSASESLRTLRFGERCQAVELGAIRRGNKRATEPPAADDRVHALQLELGEARRKIKEAEARATAAEARAAAVAAGVAATSRPSAPPAASPLAATLGGATLAQTSRCLSAARRQQLGLFRAKAGPGNENRTPNGSPARPSARRPLCPRPDLPPGLPSALPQLHKLRHSRSARLPTRAAVAERVAHASTPRGDVFHSQIHGPTPGPPLERSRRETVGPRDLSSARQRALLYEAGRFR